MCAKKTRVVPMSRAQRYVFEIPKPECFIIQELTQNERDTLSLTLHQFANVHKAIIGYMDELKARVKERINQKLRFLTEETKINENIKKVDQEEKKLREKKQKLYQQKELLSIISAASSAIHSSMLSSSTICISLKTTSTSFTPPDTLDAALVLSSIRENEKKKS